ncbi:MAG: hypothetical protein SF051_13440 [Elusimicrobiota bacterium]|nr:hypothetical protein [Elusimicrobiota bacterium]
MEDDLRARLNPESPEDARRRALRGFGVGLGVILSYFAFRAWRRDGSPLPLAAAAVLSWALAASWPAAFGPVYTPWMKVVGVLARVNLWLICGFLYYLVITPYGLLLRLFGVRPLETKLRVKDSYWEDKPPRDPAESARRQF